MESKENRLIAEFMGYIYYEPMVDIDNSDIGGIYDRCEVFSKTPIVVDKYPEDDQYYFSDVSNPNFEHDQKMVPWTRLNEYLTELKYDTSWDWLMPVVQRINELTGKKANSKIFERMAYFGMVKVDISTTYKYTVDYIKWLNEQKEELK